MLIGDIIRRSADRWPDAEALVDATLAGDGARYSFAEWNRDVNRLADAFAQRGVGEGDRVALHTYNSIPEVNTYLAVSKLGAVVVPTNHRLAAAELDHVLSLADANTLVYDPALADSVRGVERELDHVATVAHSRASDPGLADVTYSGLLDAGDPAEPPRPALAPEETNILMHTSGTTGMPKLVEVAHRGQWMNSMSNVAEPGYRHDDRILDVAPLYHSAGYFNNFLPALQLGATNVIVADFDPERTLSLVESEGITSFLGVPTHFQRFRIADVTDYDTGSLRHVVSTGASLSRPVVDWVRENLTERFFNVYGLTESTGFVTLLYPEDRHRNEDGYCIGEPFLNVEVKVVAADEDATPDDEVPPDEHGQLICRSDKITSGYRGQPEKTADALRDGWLFTGDVVRRDEDGYFYLVDRMDNRITTGAENVYPAEVERVLDGFDGVSESAVVGVPDDEWGERVVAYVVRADPDLTADDIERAWREQSRVAAFKRPREIRFVESIPTNPSGKILRDELK